MYLSAGSRDSVQHLHSDQTVAIAIIREGKEIEINYQDSSGNVEFDNNRLKNVLHSTF